MGSIPRKKFHVCLKPIADGAADVVLGARRRDGRMPLPRRFTNWLSANPGIADRRASG